MTEAQAMVTIAMLIIPTKYQNFKIFLPTLDSGLGHKQGMQQHMHVTSFTDFLHKPEQTAPHTSHKQATSYGSIFFFLIKEYK